MDWNKVTNQLKERKPQIIDSESYAKFAVLLPLIKVENELHVLFEVRALELRRQPGEICFPGGKVDKTDKNEKAAAIRETMEELGITEQEIQDVTPLDYVVSPFGTIIYPYFGTITTELDNLKPNDAEVGELFTTPLSYLQKVEPDIYSIKCKMEPEQNFPFHAIPGGANYEWQARNMEEHFYYYGDKVIWGLTARILHHFLQLLRKFERND